jgi:SAM-dependent methyltransferase
MLDLAQVGPNDVLYDLGCGDGRIVIAAARRGARGVGVDIDRLRVREGHWNADRAGVADRVRFVRDSLYDVDLRPATVVTLYLLPSINQKLRPKLLRELRTGSRIVSNYFDMADWPPDARNEAWGRQLYLWIVPAWVEGQWKCVMNSPDGRRHLALNLTRRYQQVSGTVQADRREARIEAGRLRGDRLTLRFKDPATGVPLECEATAGSGLLRGTARAAGAGAAPWPWCAWRLSPSVATA